MLPIDLHPEAEDELMVAKAWYHDVGTSTVVRFASEIDRALAEISTHPTRWPRYLADTRHFPLKHFPYIVIYRVLPDRVRVLAISHMKRDPEYWTHR